MRRVEDGTVTDEQAERLGYTLMRLEERTGEPLGEFGLEWEDLNIDLGPLGPLLDRLRAADENRPDRCSKCAVGGSGRACT